MAVNVKNLETDLKAIRDSGLRRRDASKTVFEDLLGKEVDICHPKNKLDLLLLKAIEECFEDSYTHKDMMYMAFGLLQKYQYEEYIKNEKGLSLHERRAKYLRYSNYLRDNNRNKDKDYNSASDDEKGKLEDALRKKEDKYIKKLTEFLSKQNINEYIDNLDSEEYISITLPIPSYEECNSQNINYFIQKGDFVQGQQDSDAGDGKRESGETEKKYGNKPSIEIPAPPRNVPQRKHPWQYIILLAVSSITLVISCVMVCMILFKSETKNETSTDELPEIESIEVLNKNIILYTGERQYLQIKTVPDDVDIDKYLHSTSSNPSMVQIVEGTSNTVEASKDWQEDADHNVVITVQRGRIEDKAFVTVRKLNKGTDIKGQIGSGENDSTLKDDIRNLP